VCGKKVGNFAVHLRNDHGPPGRGEIEALHPPFPLPPVLTGHVSSLLPY